MKHVNFRKIAISLVSALVVTFSAATISACKIETEHPQVEITYEFNSQTYAVKYELYRNMYPNTVKHFIELTENEFYDNTIIHDYSTSDWFAGGYSYDAEKYAELSGNASQMTEYFELTKDGGYSKEDAYMKLFSDHVLTPSVYSNMRQSDTDKDLGKYKVKYKTSDDKFQTVYEDDALPYVMGEFYNNINQEIENGKLTSEQGCLKMYYYKKTTTQKVYVTPTNKEIVMADYKNNGATSVFSIQAGSSSSYASNDYTVFGVLKSEDVYQSLLDAISAYQTDNYGSSSSSDFVLSTKARVDYLDDFSNKADADKGLEVTFQVPLKPIIIKSVKVTKY